ncbi:hypothetical protein D5F01_LYC09905 [Larimichthys crocea]|uniref:Uncharacterized protein n=1 Tax=Larimichthys crocea TaxID=215358 RepID=A0A6G0ILZ2_LARCR|nr:hypothetical protein D5F01_LYC09905 [Larimichthys crocea]
MKKLSLCLFCCSAAERRPGSGASPWASSLQEVVVVVVVLVLVVEEGGQHRLRGQARVVPGWPRTSQRLGPGLHAHVEVQRQVSMAEIQNRRLTPVRRQSAQLPRYLDRKQEEETRTLVVIKRCEFTSEFSGESSVLDGKETLMDASGSAQPEAALLAAGQ